MSALLFRYEKDAAGHPAAHPIGGAHAGLARFLTEEVTSEDYIGLLTDCVADAKKTGKPAVNTGNAYAVTIGGAEAVLEHLHDRHRAAVKVPLAVFELALAEWKAFTAGA